MRTWRTSMFIVLFIFFYLKKIYIFINGIINNDNDNGRNSKWMNFSCNCIATERIIKSFRLPLYIAYAKKQNHIIILASCILNIKWHRNGWYRESLFVVEPETKWKINHVNSQICLLLSLLFRRKKTVGNKSVFLKRIKI